jgi:uncharacterized protein (DUF342 family)
MLDFARLQQVMKDRLERDRKITSVETEGATLEEAVAEAAALLSKPVRHIEYEITVRGFAGFMGAGASKWKIRAYERVSEKAVKKEQAEAVEAAGETVKKTVHKDGEAFVKLFYDGVYLKVLPPDGKGKRVQEAAVDKRLADRGISEYDKDKVNVVIQEAGGIYVRIGEFQRLPANDSMINVDVTADEMKAYITISPPGLGGCDLSMEGYLAALRNSKVVFGVDEEALGQFADKPVYKEPFLAAEGIRSNHGNDSYIKYNFASDQPKINFREASNGRIDFKELNIIQNVVKDQPLAVKIPAEKGTDGKTITGKIIPAQDGKDLAMPLGKNVRAGEDGVTIIADMNGQVIVSNGNINVEPVYTVQGNVGVKTGNIIFLGTVFITGNVEEGFSVKAAGNIEIKGTVEKAELDAEGDIIVHQGITGKGDNVIRSGRSIWARFIENAQVEAGNMIVISDGIINSKVDAFRKIICQGKRASIVGGRLRATEEINAKSIGSPTSGTETVCEVGFDPKSKQRLEILEAQNILIDKQLEELQLNIQTLINIKKQRMSLPEDKEAYLDELMDKRQELNGEFQKNKDEMERLHSFLRNLEGRGRISAFEKVFPGVRITIRDIKEDVKTDYKSVTFILENGLIRATAYEDPDEESTKGPDGYSPN